MASALGIVGVAAGARGFLTLADQSKQLTAQLRLATAESGSFAKAQDDVRRISEDSRSGLQETGSLYGSFVRTSQELGRSQAEASQATETFTKALKIGGAGTAQVQSATLQMGQALASTNVQWEELGQILEASPRLAKVFTDSLGVTRQQLKQMASDGKLSGEMLFNALNDRDITKKINAEFGQLPVTFDEAMTQVHNAALITFGAFDRGGQFSTALANFITTGTDGFKELEGEAVNLGIEVRATFEGLANVFDPMLQGALNAFGLIDARAKSTRDAVAELLGAWDSVVNAAPQLGNKAKAFDNKWFGTNWQMDPLSNRRGAFLQGYDEAELRGKRANGLTPVSRMLGRLSEASNRPAQAPPRAAPAGDKKKGPKGPSAETLRKRAEAEAERAADALRRFTDDLAREQADLTEAMARLSGNTDALADAEVAKIEADRQVREREIRDRERISDAQKQQLIDLNNQNADAQKQAIRQREIEQGIERQADIAVDRLGLEEELLRLSGNLARTAIDRRDVELRILDLAFEQERVRLEGIKATKAVNSKEWAYANDRLARLDDLKGGATARVMRDTQGPLESFLDSLPQTAEEASEALERVRVDGINGLIDGLAQASTNIKDLGNVFKNVATQIIQDLIRIQLQKAVVGALGSALGLGGPKLSGVDFGAISSAANSVSLPGFATGGSFKVGGSSSVGDQNLVMFRANAGEMVDIRKPGTDTGGGAAIRVEAVPNPYFDVRVSQVASPIAAGAGMHASRDAQGSMMRRAKRRLPG